MTTVYDVEQSNASPPLNLEIVNFPSKKIIFLDFNFVCDNVYNDCVKRCSNSSHRILALNKLS